MKQHTILNEQARELAALHALGALTADEAGSYEAHVARCPACRKELESLRAVAAELALLAPQAEPPPALKSRVLKVAREAASPQRPEAVKPVVQPWRAWPAAVGQGPFTLARASDAAWEPTGFEGIETRKLFVNPEKDRVTMLVRMAAGTSYPPLRHRGPEECYVIEGDLRAGTLSMHAGDYKFADADSIDGLQSTDGGCLLLIVSSLHDELLPETRA